MIISVKNLWKKFDNKEVLKGLNIDIEPGETVVILGRSGVGKSVLLKHLIGIDKPDQGEIIIDGAVISSLNEKQLYESIKNMGMLFQGGALFDSMSIDENTGFYLRQHPDPQTGKTLTAAELKDRVEEALALVGLENVGNRMPSELSGGMRKRAALARLIAYRPKILLYDEPTTGLDPITSEQINELILRIQSELKATSIVVTHDIVSAMAVGNRLALHHDGKIKYFAKKDLFPHIDDPLIRAFFANYNMKKGHEHA